MVNHDAVWLSTNLPKPDYSTRVNKPLKDWDAFDQIKAEELELIFDSAYVEGLKPEWISGPMALKLAGLQNIFRQQAAKLPHVAEVLERRVVTKQDFLMKIFRWSIQEIEKEGEEITLQTIQQKSGFCYDYIRQHEYLLFKVAQEIELVAKRQRDLLAGTIAQLDLF